MRRGDEVLLGMKKRRFGTGKWNGFGGKLLEGETIEAALLREMNEEIGVTVAEESLEKVANLVFLWKNGLHVNVHTYVVKSWTGEPQESEEMAPRWFKINEIPFDAMWADDKHWLPLVLAGKKIEAEFHFTEDGNDFEWMDVKEV